MIFLLLTLQLVLLVCAAPSCPKGSVVDPISGGCYTLSIESLDFWSAEAHCNSMNGHLASISGGAQNALLAATLTEWNVSNNVWIGLTAVLNGDKSWQWTDHSSVAYTNWQGGVQPAPVKPYDCAQIDETYGFWSPMNCSTRLQAVCSVSKIDSQFTSTQTPTTKKDSQLTTTQIPTTNKDQQMTSSQPPTTRKNCASDWTQFNNHCYKVFTSITSQHEEWAISTCNMYESELASIHSAEENNIILGLANTDPTQPCAIWIGLERNNNTGIFYWRDNTTVDYTNWYIRTPNYYNCAAMFTNEASGRYCANFTNGTWGNGGTETFGVACKI